MVYIGFSVQGAIPPPPAPLRQAQNKKNGVWARKYFWCSLGYRAFACIGLNPTLPLLLLHKEYLSLHACRAVRVDDDLCG